MIRRARIAILSLALIHCGTTPSSKSAPTTSTAPTSASASSSSAPLAAPETVHLVGDTDVLTPGGGKVVAPKGWFMTRRGAYVDLEDPDRALHVLLAELAPMDGVEAIAATWKIVGRAPPPVVKTRTPPDDYGWEQYTAISYQDASDGSRDTFAWAVRGGGHSFVFIVEGKRTATASRYAQVSGIFHGLQVDGVHDEDVSNKSAAPFAGKVVDDFASFVEKARAAAHVPGIAVAVVQNGKVVFAKGFGVRALGKNDPMTPDTRMMIGSETKSLTTLMMAKLVDDGKLRWDEPVVEVLPTFALADAEVTKKLLLWQTVCACTGIPRRDYEILLGPRPSPEAFVAGMKTMKQTTAVGEVFQYNNELVALGGYVAGHAFDGKKPLGDAYEAAMQKLVFGPIGMTSTTLAIDALAATKNVASGYTMSIDGDPMAIGIAAEKFLLPIRPAGAVSSTANDMAKWLLTELARGVAPSGKTVATDKNVTRRWEPQMKITDSVAYGLGLRVGKYHAIRVVSHGGATAGFTSDAMWMPDKGVGVVFLMNGNWQLTEQIRVALSRRLFELLFDAKPDADARLKYALESHADDVAKERARIGKDFPEGWLATYAGTYENGELGKVRVYEKDGAVRFDGGEWNARIAPKTADDGTAMVTTIDPPYVDEEFFARVEGEAPVIVFETPQEKFVFRRVPAKAK